MQHQRVAQAGGTLNRELKSIRGGAYTIPRSALERLAADPDVVHISPDHGLRGMLKFANPAVNANIALANGYSGTGIGVAVLDSGVNEPDDLGTGNSKGSRVIYSESFSTGAGDTKDKYGHGTHVAGVIVGRRRRFIGQSLGIPTRSAGVLRRMRISSISKFWTRTAMGTDSTVIAGIESAVALKTQYNIRVLNLSLGRPISRKATFSIRLCQAVEFAWRNGITNNGGGGWRATTAASTSSATTATAPLHPRATILL